MQQHRDRRCSAQQREPRGHELRQRAARPGDGQEVLRICFLLGCGLLLRARAVSGLREAKSARTKRGAYLEGDEADDDAGGEERKGLDEPDDAPDWRDCEWESVGRGYGGLTLRGTAAADLGERRRVRAVDLSCDRIVYICIEY